MGDHMVRRRRIAAAVALVLTLTTLPGLTRPAGADGTSPFTTSRSMVVDPGTGRVFVSGDDGVAALSPTGQLIGQIPGISGARGMDATQGSIWVSATGTDEIVRVDPVDLDVVERHEVEASIADEVTIVGTTAWFNDTDDNYRLTTLDLTTGATTRIDASTPRSGVRRIGSATDAAVVFERHSSAGAVQIRSTNAPFEVIRTGSVATRVEDLAVSADGLRMWTAGDYPKALSEVSASTLMPTGVTLPFASGTRKATASDARGGIVVGVASGHLRLFREGVPTVVGTASVPAISSVPPDLDDPDLALAPDGQTAYLLLEGSPTLRVIDLRPDIPTAPSTSATRGSSRLVTVGGRFLGGTTAVTVGGVATDPIDVSETSVSFRVPAATPVGAQTVVASGPTGAATTTLTVTPDEGATLGGTVTSSDTPLSGAQLELSGGSLASPQTTTTADDGTYSFAGVPVGRNYRLDAHDPGSSGPDQQISRIVLSSEQPTTLDIDLTGPDPTGPVVADTKLGGAAPKDLVVEPTTGRVAVAVDGEVDILDAEGALLARVLDLPGATALTRMGTDIYVGSGVAARITRIDLESLHVTGSWPLGVLATGSIAAAGNRIWFVDGAYGLEIRSLDPVTGAVSNGHGPLVHGSTLESVEGAPDLLVAADEHSTAHRTALLRANGDDLDLVAEIDNFDVDTTPVAPVVASASTGKLIDAQGHRFDLDDLRPDGFQYPGSGRPAYAPGSGGVVAMGASAWSAADAVRSHAFDTWSIAPGLAASGRRLYAAGPEGRIVTYDLAPTVTSTGGYRYGGQPATLLGTGLGQATRVEVDGAPVAVTAKAAGQITLTLPDLAIGLHQVTVTTPWGTSKAAPLRIGPARPPRPPSSIGASSDRRDVVVSWQPSPDDGGTPVTSFEVTASPGGATCIASASERSCRFSGLAQGSTFTFTVTATNAVGSSDPSTPTRSLAVPLKVTPAPPTDVDVALGDRAATLSWSPPGDDGGSPITSYHACIWREAGPLPASGTCEEVPAGTTTIAFTGLPGGLRQQFSVQAVNAYGESTRAAIERTLAPSVPDQPSNAAAYRGSSSIRVDWYDHYDGGSPITSYRVCATPDPTPPGAAPTCIDAPGSPATVPNLTPGVAYRSTVAATNAVGTGASSEPSSGSATPYTFAAAPTGVTAQAGARSAVVQWTAPADGGSVITGYVITPILEGVAQQPVLASAGQVASQLNDLRRTRRYAFTVAAVNAAGTGTASAPTAEVIPTRPGTPFAPFDSWDAFVSEQLRDFTGVRGSVASRAPSVAALTAGTTTAEAYIESLLALPAHQSVVPPTARLYWAFFNRIPDGGGLRHWSDLRRSGVSLIRISASFAGSSEFKRKYGSLSNTQFVDLVYRNVLGRPGDAGGRSYWITKLNRGTSRGQVMVNFSESGEYVRRMARPVSVVDTVVAMTLSSPTTAELAAWVNTDLRDLIIEIFDSQAYAHQHP